MPPETTAPPESLRAIYDALLAHITGRKNDGDGGDGAAGELPDDLPDATALVAGDARASAAERIHIYEHMYRARIVEALESQFPRLARWLGADAFGDIAAAYVTDVPSRHPSLRFLGQRFADWLAARAPAVAGHPALPDLARLEWAREDVFDAADEVTLTLDAVRDWPADRFGEIPLRLIGACRRLELARPVAALWNAIGPAGSAQEPPAPDADPSEGGESLLVWRQGIAVFHRVTDGAEAAALESLARGATFGAICEALCCDLPEDQATAQGFAWLSTWGADELLAAP